MCKFKSFILTSERLYWRLDTDSHETLLMHLGLSDTSSNPDFVRLEFVPRNIWDADFETWEMVVDQDLIPSWFQVEAAREKVLKAMPSIYSHQVAIDTEIEIVSWEEVYLKNTRVLKASGNASIHAYGDSTIVAMCDSSQASLHDSANIRKMFDNSQVLSMRDHSQVQHVLDYGCVCHMRDHSTISQIDNQAVVRDMKGYTSVTNAYGAARIGRMADHSQANLCDQSQVNLMADYSQVGYMCGESVVRGMWGSSVVSRMGDYSTVIAMHDTSCIEAMHDYCRVAHMCDDARVRNIYESAMAISAEVEHVYLHSECKYVLNPVRNR
jgi:hypothetical protein